MDLLAHYECPACGEPMPESTLVGCADPRCDGLVIYEPAAKGMRLRGAVSALEEARALIETAEQDAYVSAGWREDARTWAATWADALGGQ